MITKHISILLLLLVLNNNIKAQCGTTISIFPYTESFETSTGNWGSGGTNNSWAWGTPAKSIINTAGSGTKCWIVGGLTGNSYTNCERSYVESPCFDFTTLDYPEIAFKLYWECEFQYDGLVLQYSLNSGSSWTNVGAFGDPINCYNANWYNYNNITHLGSSGGCTGSLTTTKHGWCGNSLSTTGGCQGGSGSNNWVIAKHCMANLAGQPSVKFRFAFGAGSSCNTYNGVAFDSVAIFNNIPMVANFTNTCNGINSVQFTNSSSSCVSTYSWNFGDPTSGASNISTATNPTHVFSNTGIYTVTLITNSACAASDTFTKVIALPTLSVIKNNITCNGANNGSITATATNITGAPIYGLNPGAITNGTGNFTSLSPGAYTVGVTDANNCAASTVLVITQPNAITATILPTSSNTICIAGTGSITAIASGGSGALNYTLNPGNSTNTTGIFTGLSAATFTIVVTDANGCTTATTHAISGGSSININSITYSPINCNGQTTTVNVIGTGPITNYNLQAGNLNNSTGIYNFIAAGNYTITIADASGCTKSSTVNIQQPPALNFVLCSPTNPICSYDGNGKVDYIAFGGVGAITYNLMPNNIAGVGNVYNNLSTGSYTITATDALGCSTASIFAITYLSPLININLAATNIGCVGVNNDGSIATTITGGAAPFTYIWNTIPPSNTASLTNLFAGKYAVLVTDGNGCINADSAIIEAATCCESIYFPNAFSPNNDGINDVFAIKTFINFELQEFSIFNRYGQKVWTTANYKNGWDGSYKNATCDMGNYYYYFKYKCLQDGKNYIKQGDVFLNK